MKIHFRLPSIYPITDKELARRSDHCSIVEDLVRGGARLVQIRDKHTPAGELLRDLGRCVDFALKRNARLILNDRCDLVLCGGLSGVHLGQEDLPPGEARTLLGEESIIGFSTHTLSQVRKASRLPVQYIGFGPVFQTSTKANASRAVGLSALRSACRQSPIPVVAIGGIGLQQVRGVLDAGAAAAAVISALMKSKNISGKMEEFIEAAMGR
ncbi:MAG: thiamine phosphate synthase [Acidobacteria bacterium]|nr:thiamine phosphate synthase [Acidobacteriota bacterium]